ncbi:MAG: hypothetical protein M3O15_04140 [Acidobacteriota bacterium]|nr:hypothetical protein [Acidobacteriota bacterium]
MSESSSGSPEMTWGTPESHWPFPRPVAAPTDEDRARFAALTPEQRGEWLLMMLRLLELQFGHLVRPPFSRPPGEPQA